MSEKLEGLDIFAAYATDETLEDQGTWRRIGGGAEILVARLGNPNYEDAVKAEVAANRETLDLGGEELAQAYKELSLRVLARTILLGWKNVSYKGKPLDYSVQAAEMLLAHREFRRVVEEFASDFNQYRAKLEEDQGNG
jgi:hypothetical protein